MDSSKSLEECSSSESGWTRYIASSPDHDDNDDDDEGDEDSTTAHQQEGYRKGPEDVVDSDDSMASDASSGPSNQYGLGHVRSKNDKKYVGKKISQHDEKKKQHEKKKADKDKPGNRANSAGRSKKA